MNTKHKAIALFASGIFILSLFFSYKIYKLKILSWNNQKVASVIPFTDYAKKAKERKIKENIEKYHPKSNFIKEYPTNLDISAKSAILIDYNSGQILFQKDPNIKLLPASIIKILTATVTLENLKLDQLVTISQRAADMEPNKIVMKAGEKIKVNDLLFGLMMISANDSAEALAENIEGGRENFIKKMNEKIEILGLKNTNVKNPSGLDEEDQFSSSFDIATITRYALMDHPEIINYMGKREYAIQPSDLNKGHWLYHISYMIDIYPGMEGVKTGYTDDAHNTFIGIAKRGNHRLICVFLASDNANEDCRKIFDFGFNQAETLNKFQKSFN